MINQKMRELGAHRSVIRELFEYGKQRKAEIGEDKVFDFSLGNPTTTPPKEVVSRLGELISTKEPTFLHAYTSADGDISVRRAIANYINECENESILPDCIYMTVGAAGALTSILTALVGENEEVICLTPYFPEYKVFIERCGGICKEVMTRPRVFTPDAFKIEEAITEKTAAIIINSPNNPTGVIYSEEDITALAEVLKRASQKFGKPIYLISDEPYRELVYSDKKVPFVTKYYDNSIIAYSYSKSFSLPGERIGYALICPRISDFDEVRYAIMGAGRALGFVCAPSLFQRLLTDTQGVMPELSEYKKNRDALYNALTEYGYDAVMPEGAFYLFVKALEDDAMRFSEIAKKFELLLVPGDSFGAPGYVRISYCVGYEVIKNSLPAFKALKEYYEGGK